MRFTVSRDRLEMIRNRGIIICAPILMTLLPGPH